MPADVSAPDYVRPYDFDLVDLSPPEIDRYQIGEYGDNFYVVRDDLLEGGTKVRYLRALVNAMAQNPESDEVVFAGPAQGALPLALSVLYGSRTTLWYPQRKLLTPRQKETLENGAKHIYSEAPYIRPSAVKKRAREYSEARGALCIRWSLSYPEVVESIAMVAHSVEVRYGPFEEVWVAGGGGTLTRGMCEGFSAETQIHCVGVGRAMQPHEVGRAIVHTEPFMSMDKAVPEAHMPPFDCDPWYDAKAWFVAANGCSCHGIRATKGKKLFWNVVRSPRRDLWNK